MGENRAGLEEVRRFISNSDGQRRSYLLRLIQGRLVPQNHENSDRPELDWVPFDDIMNAGHDSPPPSEPVPRKREAYQTIDTVVAAACRIGSELEEAIET